MIIRTPKSKNYAVIDNRALSDERLSWRARGMLAYLLSKPDGWEVMAQHLINTSPDGRRVVEATLKELEELGYIERGKQPRGEKGTFDSVSTVVHEEPTSGFPTKAQVATDVQKIQRTTAQVATDVHLPRAEKPRAEKPRADDVRRVKTELSMPEGVKTEEVKNLVPHVQETGHDEVAEGTPDDVLLKERLIVAETAFDASVAELFPWMSANKRARYRGQAIGTVQMVCYDYREELPYALVSMADRMHNRADLIKRGKSTPVESENFIIGLANQVVENWTRDGQWVGSNSINAREEWDLVLEMAAAS